MNKEPAQKGLIELTAGSCKKSACGTRACTCRKNELCSCIAGESCQKPKNASAVDDDDI